MINYTRIQTPTGESLTVYAQNQLFTITGEDYRFDRVLELIEQDREDDIATLLSSTMPSLVGLQMQKLSRHVTYRQDTDELLFDGEPVGPSISRYIRESLRRGDSDWKPLAEFLERLAKNPSMSARRELFSWLDEEGLRINTEGLIIAYKGLTSNSTSVMSGSAYVDGVLVTGQIPNHVGSVISMDRKDVDDHFGTVCAEGLHAGTTGYARSFSKGLIATVLIDPEDVVSVPSSASAEKLRTCRYKVARVELLDASSVLATNTVIDSEQISDDDNDDDDDHQISVTDFTTK